MNLSERLRKLLEESPRSQREIAAEARIAEGTLSLYKKGERSPGAEELYRLARALTVPMEFFWEDPSSVQALHEGPEANEALVWKRRAVMAEKRLNDLQNLLREALKRSSASPPLQDVESELPSSETHLATAAILDELEQKFPETDPEFLPQPATGGHSGPKHPQSGGGGKETRSRRAPRTRPLK